MANAETVVTDRLDEDLVEDIKDRSSSEVADIGILCIQQIKARVYAEFGGHGSLKKAAGKLDLHPSTITNAFSAADKLRALADLIS